MRLIDLSLDQLSTNSLLCRLWYDSSPCPCSSCVLRLLLLKVFQEYIGRERKSNTKKVQSKKKERANPTKKKETQLTEKNEQWNAREQREREHGFYVIPIETDFYGKVYPSLVPHEI